MTEVYGRRAVARERDGRWVILTPMGKDQKPATRVAMDRAGLTYQRLADELGWNWYDAALAGWRLPARNSGPEGAAGLVQKKSPSSQRGEPGTHLRQEALILRRVPYVFVRAVQSRLPEHPDP
jgi:hypothetical protein